MLEDESHKYAITLYILVEVLRFTCELGSGKTVFESSCLLYKINIAWCLIVVEGRRVITSYLKGGLINEAARV